MKQKIAFVMADETLERFGVGSVTELLALMKKTYIRFQQGHIPDPFRYKVVPFDKISHGIDDNKYQILKENELTAVEKLWLVLMQSKARLVLVDDKIVYGGYGDLRRIFIGVSDTANGWTDGSSYVAISRQYLSKQDMTVRGITNIGTLLLHEACHQDPDTQDHDHDQSFYERFEQATRYTLGDFVAAAISVLPQLAERIDRKLTRAQMQSLDKASMAVKAGSNLTQQVAANAVDVPARRK
jgi:hypothetical protein